MKPGPPKNVRPISQQDNGPRHGTDIFMSHFVQIGLLFFVLSIILPFLFRLLGFSKSPRDKVRGIVEYARKRGYTLVNPAIEGAMNSSLLEMAKNPALRNTVHASSDISDIEDLSNGTGDWLAFTCRVGSKEATIFNLSVTPRNVHGGQDIRYKVAKIKAPGLPQFSLGKNSILRKVEDVVGKLTGTPAIAVNVDARQHPEFAAHYWIRGADPAAVLNFLTSEKIRFIETAGCNGILATNRNYLVYHEDGVLQAEADFDSFIARVEKIEANIL